MAIEVRALWFDADGQPLDEERRDRAVTVELEEYETETGYVLQRTYATLDYEDDLDNTVAFAPLNSDFTKGTWDLTVTTPIGLKRVETFAELRTLLGEDRLREQLTGMMELPVWDVAPEDVKRGAYAWLRGQAGETKQLAPDAGREALREDWYDFVLRWEARLSDVLERFYERQEAVVLARLRGTKIRRGTRHWEPAPLESKAIDPNQVLSAERWKAEVEGDVSQTVLHLFQATAAKVGEQAGAGGPTLLFDAPEVQDAIRARVQRIMGTTERRAEQVRQVIMDADASEADLDEIVRRVAGTYEQRQIWASGASRNEVTPAVNTAMLLEAAKTGLTTKTWLSSRDDRVRFTHTHEGGGDGQDAVLFRPFLIGGFPLMFPGDPTGPPQEVRNCRCVMTFRKDEDVEVPEHPWWAWLAEALDRLLQFMGIDAPESLAPEALEGQGDVAERLAELIQVHAAQAANASPKAAGTRERAVELARELGWPNETVEAMATAMLLREAAT